ncbi:hypothetical protein JXD38_09285 [candidate division WOR-3 bacterium]|nr:hypothetical protein [candidate division WOR-3 bacterium]
MRQSLFVLLALTLVLLACGGQKPAAARPETTSACCDSATMANCCSESADTDCAGPADTADSAADKASPAQCVT